ncbi:ribose-phosphate pyrophosphokinase [Alteromonas sp. S167]|uniref:ribose-phosphate pyrophosphokinase n=1 Tax=Alteromonas sp. S167 TaxID=3117402 RepID=UPI002FE3D4E6
MKFKELYCVAALASFLALTACSGEEESGENLMAEKSSNAMPEKAPQPASKELPTTLTAKPTPEPIAKDVSVEDEVTLTGSIIFKELEGGFYAFIAESGDRYTLHNLEEQFQQNGLIAKVTGVPKPKMMTFTQFGTVLQVTSVEIIDSSKVTNKIAIE